jgi:hypothetical protein
VRGGRRSARAATLALASVALLAAPAGAAAAPSPPGSNDPTCKPTAAHPFPVVLVHGTFENMDDNWQAAAPLLANHGYCVFAFNYGGATADSDFQGTGDIAAAAGQLAAFVNHVPPLTLRWPGPGSQRQ